MTSDYVKPGQKQMHEALEAAGVRVVVAKEAGADTSSVWKRMTRKGSHARVSRAD